MDKKQDSRLKVFLTTTLVGIILFTVFQAVVGDLFSEWLKIKLAGKSADPRFRYFLLDLRAVKSPLDGELLKKLFKDANVYLYQNEVERVLLPALASSLILSTEPLGARRHASPDDYRRELGYDELVISNDIGWDGPNQKDIIEYISFPECRDLSNRAILHDRFSVALATENPFIRRIFYSRLADLRQKCVAYDGPPPYFEEGIFAEPPKLLLLDIENSTGRPLEGIRLEAKEFVVVDRPFKLFAGIQAEEGSRYREVSLAFSPRILLPGEHILVPLSLVFEEFSQQAWPFPHTEPPTEVLWQSTWGVAEGAQTMKWYGGYGSSEKRTFYHLRPQYIVNELVTSASTYPVRRLEPKDLTYAVIEGAEVGSCPHVFVQTPGGTEIDIGPILVTARGPARKRSEFRRVGMTARRIILKEVEDEVSYLDRLSIKVRLASGAEQECLTSDPLLREEDNYYRVLRKGEEVALACPGLGSMDVIEVRASGYYETLSPSEGGVPRDSTVNPAPTADGWRRR